MIKVLFTKFAPRFILFLAITVLCAAPAHAVEFHYDGATHSIEMTGTIHAGDGMTFSSMLRSHPDTESIELSGSVGGEYTSSLEMSLEVKKYRLNTVSSNYCHSGCAYIWLAGATREVVGSANPEIHLPYANATGEAFPKLTYDWFKALGLSATFADAVVESVGPNNKFVQLTPEFLAKFGAFQGQHA